MPLRTSYCTRSWLSLRRKAAATADSTLSPASTRPWRRAIPRDPAPQIDMRMAGIGTIWAMISLRRDPLARLVDLIHLSHVRYHWIIRGSNTKTIRATWTGSSRTRRTFSTTLRGMRRRPSFRTRGRWTARTPTMRIWRVWETQRTGTSLRRCLRWTTSPPRSSSSSRSSSGRYPRSRSRSSRWRATTGFTTWRTTPTYMTLSATYRECPRPQRCPGSGNRAVT